MEIQVNDGSYRIVPYSYDIVETSFIPNGEEFLPDSHAVVLQPKGVNYKVSDTESHLIYESTGLSIRIQKQPFQIRYYYHGNFLISEKRGISK